MSGREYELRLARVNTNTRWGHRPSASLTSRGEPQKYWKGASPSHQVASEIDGDDTVVNTRVTHTSSRPVKKREKRTGFHKMERDRKTKYDMGQNTSKTIDSSLSSLKNKKKKIRGSYPAPGQSRLLTQQSSYGMVIASGGGQHPLFGTRFHLSLSAVGWPTTTETTAQKEEEEEKGIII